MGFTNDPVSEIISPTLTTIAEPAFDIGRISCELLLKHINKKSFASQEVVLPGELTVRESSQRSPVTTISHLLPCKTSTFRTSRVRYRHVTSRAHCDLPTT